MTAAASRGTPETPLSGRLEGDGAAVRPAQGDWAWHHEAEKYPGQTARQGCVVIAGKLPGKAFYLLQL